jgi:hypothetical protein
MNEDFPQPKVNKNLFSECLAKCQNDAKLFHEREIAAVITSVALATPNLLNFQIFPSLVAPAIGAFKMIATANGLKKPMFTPWEKFMVVSTLKHIDVFVGLARYIVLSPRGKENEGFWNGKGRLIDTKEIENLRAIWELERGVSGPPRLAFQRLFYRDFHCSIF